MPDPHLGPESAVSSDSQETTDVGVEPSLLEQSPVLQRWLVSPPDLLQVIRETPAVPFRLQVGVPRRRGVAIALQDLPLGDRLTLSADYLRLPDRPRPALVDDRVSYGAVLRYYLAARGSYVNVAPQLGYRAFELGAFGEHSPVTGRNHRLDGATFGLAATVSLAPESAHLTTTYEVLSPFTDQEVTVGTVTAAYRVSRAFWLSAQYRWQHSRWRQRDDLGIFVEWTP